MPHAPLQVQQRKHSGNTARQWARRAAKRRIFQPKYVTVSSRKSRHDLSMVDRRLAIVSMKDMAVTLFNSHRHILFGPAGACERFWEKFRKVKPAHPIFQECTADELRYVFPFAIHGDEGSGLAAAPTLVLSWHPVLSFKEELKGWHKRFLIAICPARLMADNTLRELGALTANERPCSARIAHLQACGSMCPLEALSARSNNM